MGQTQKSFLLTIMYFVFNSFNTYSAYTSDSTSLRGILSQAIPSFYTRQSTGCTDPKILNFFQAQSFFLPFWVLGLYRYKSILLLLDFYRSGFLKQQSKPSSPGIGLLLCGSHIISHSSTALLARKSLKSIFK